MRVSKFFYLPLLAVSLLVAPPFSAAQDPSGPPADAAPESPALPDDLVIPEEAAPAPAATAAPAKPAAKSAAKKGKSSKKGKKQSKKGKSSTAGKTGKKSAGKTAQAPKPRPRGLTKPLSEFELARYQYCGSDKDCIVAQNGCCDCANGGEDVAVNKERFDAFRSRFDCLYVNCGDKEAVPACTSGVVSCVNHKCRYIGDTPAEERF